MQQTTGATVSKSTSSSGGVTVVEQQSDAARPGNTVTVVNFGGGDADSSGKDVQLLRLYSNLWYGQMVTLPRLQDRRAGARHASSSATPCTPPGPRPILCRLPVSTPLSVGKSAVLPSASTLQGKHAHVSSTRDNGLFSPLFTSTPTQAQPTNQSLSVLSSASSTHGTHVHVSSTRDNGLFPPRFTSTPTQAQPTNQSLPDLGPSTHVLGTTTSSRATSTSEERHFVFTTSTHLAVPLYGPHSSGLASTTPTGRQPTVLAPPSYVGKALTHAAERVFTTIASHTFPKPSCCTTPHNITGPTASSGSASTVENEGKSRNSEGKETVLPSRCLLGPRRCLAKEFGQQKLGTNQARNADGKVDDKCSVLPDTPRAISFPCQRDSCPSPIGEGCPSSSVTVVTSVRPSPVFVTSPCLRTVRKPNSAPAIPAYLTKSPEDQPHTHSPIYLLSNKPCLAQHHRLLHSCTKPKASVKPLVRMRATVPQQESTVYTVQLFPKSNQATAYLPNVPETVKVGKTAGVTAKLLSGKPGGYLQPNCANKATVLLSPPGPNRVPCAGRTRSQCITPGSKRDDIRTKTEIQSTDFDPSVFLVALPSTEKGVCRKNSISRAPFKSHSPHHATKDHYPNVPFDAPSKDFDSISSYGRQCRGATQIYGFSLAPIPQPEGYPVICPHCGRDLTGERLEITPTADPVSWYDKTCYICQRNPYKARCYK
ncbi:uncharacterized protein LOC144904925 [Branchiostoma floridae x Branchiostoma belcheri]